MDDAEAVMSQLRAPRITIGVPVYNGGDQLRRALESACAQTVRDFTLVIADNASVDNTAHIGLEFAQRDDRIRYVRHAKNLGARANFQFLVNEAHTELFVWLASDDTWQPHHLEELIAALDRSPRAVAAMSATELVRDDGSTVRTVSYDGRKNPEQTSSWRMGWRIAAGAPYHYYFYAVHRTALIRQEFIRVPHVKGFDRLFILRLALEHRLAYASGATYRRKVYDVPSIQRFIGTDIQNAQLYRTEFKYVDSIRTFVPYMLDGRPRSVKRLLAVILCFIRYAWFTGGAMVREIGKWVLLPSSRLLRTVNAQRRGPV